MSTLLTVLDELLHSSVTAVSEPVLPPAAHAKSTVPPDATLVLAVLKSATSTQLTPFHSSVLPDTGGGLSLIHI